MRWRLIFLAALGLGLMPNDTCAAATAIALTPGTPFTGTYDTTGNGGDATLSPACWSNTPGAKVAWFRVTAPINGALLVDTHGSNYDTELVAYAGACGSLTELDCSEDDGLDYPPDNNGFQSSVNAVPVTAGVPIYLAVADYDGVGGSLVLNIALVGLTGTKRVIIENDQERDELQGYTPGQARTAQGPIHAYSQPASEPPGIITSGRQSRMATRDGTRLYNVQYTGATAETGYAIQVYDAALQALPIGIDLCDGGINALGFDAAGNVYAFGAGLNGVPGAFIVKLSSDLSLLHTFTDATITENTRAVGASPDGSILYYNEAGTHAGKILRYDTASETPLSDLATLPGGDDVFTIYVAANGDVIVLGNTDVYRYSAAGALLSQATLPDSSYGNGPDPDDLSIWCFDGATLRRALIADGSVIESEAIDATIADEPQSNGIAVMAPADAPALHFLVWLQDGTYVAFVGTFLGDGYVARWDLRGRETQRFTWAPGLHAEGVCGIAASLESDACSDGRDGRLYVFFGAIGGAAAALAFDLKTGAQLGDLMPLTGIADTDTDVAAGVVHLGNAGPSTDGSLADLDDDGTIDDDPETPPCAPPGPGGSSFDGSPDGDRAVQPGGVAATYVPPTGEGAVATADDPVDPQSLETLTTPHVSLDITVCDGTVFRLAKQRLPRAGAPQMDPRVLRFPDVPYPFSDRFGSLPSQVWEVEIADEDGFYRGMLAAGANRFYKRWTADLFVEDDAARRQGTPRQRLARGRCVTVRTGTQDQSLVLVFSDEYSRHDSPLSLDRELSHVLVGEIFGAGASSPDVVTLPTPSEEIAANPARMLPGETSDEYRAAENPPVTPIGIVPLWDLGDVQLGSETWRAYFVCLYASHSVPALFGSNLDATCPASVRLDPALYNGDQAPEFLVPGYAPWDAYFAHKYIEIVRDGVTYWVTLIFGRGPISDAHVTQHVPLSANVNGVEDVGDGTGALIDDGAHILQWLLDHPFLRKTTSGLWGDVARFADGVAKIRTSDFAAVKAIHDARLSGRYRGAVILDQRRAARDWIADLCVSFSIRLGINHHGQITARTLNVGAALAGLRTFTDLAHIRDESFTVTSELNAELENSLEYEAGPEPASGRVTVGKQTIQAPDSIRDWGTVDEETDPEVYAAQPITFVGLYRPDVAGSVASYRLIDTQDGITKGVFDVDLAGGTIRGGELVRLTHLAGIGTTGWRSRVLMATTRVLRTDDLQADRDFQTAVNWEDLHVVLVKPGTDDEPRFGFKPIGSWQANTGWTVGSSVTGTAYRAG